MSYPTSKANTHDLVDMFIEELRADLHGQVDNYNKRGELYSLFEEYVSRFQ